MDWSTVLKGIASIAPTIATALGGPLAGLGVEAVGKALGIDQPTINRVQDVLTQGQLSADQIVALRTAEDSLKVRMRELNIQEESLTYQDRANARQMQVANKDWMPRALAIGLLLGAACLFAAVITGNVTKDPSLAVQLGAIIGYVTSELKAVFAFYFGSSRGSDDKSATIAEIAKQ
jgi:hypothetical protein